MTESSPNICPTLTTLHTKFTEEVAQYKATLALFEREGTTALRDSLIAQKENLLRTKATINAVLNPLGYDIDTPLPKWESPEEITKRLKEIGSPAVLDESFGEKGIVSIDITPELREQLKDWLTARATYEAADNGSPSYIWDALKDYSYEPPTTTSLDVVVLNHGATTPQDRDTMVSHMDSLGYRPLTLAELIALGVLKPELNKRSEILNTYKPHTLVGYSRTPYLRWSGDNRALNVSFASDGWGGPSRFLFTRK